MELVTRRGLLQKHQHDRIWIMQPAGLAERNTRYLEAVDPVHLGHSKREIFHHRIYELVALCFASNKTESIWDELEGFFLTADCKPCRQLFHPVLLPSQVLQVSRESFLCGEVRLSKPPRQTHDSRKAEILRHLRLQMQQRRQQADFVRGLLVLEQCQYRYRYVDVHPATDLPCQSQVRSRELVTLEEHSLQEMIKGIDKNLNATRQIEVWNK